MLSTLKEKAEILLRRHGAEASMVAKIVANALMPGAPMLVSAVEAVCDYAQDEQQRYSEEQIIQRLSELGGDTQQLGALLDHMNGQLDQLMGRLSEMTQKNASVDDLERVLHSELDSTFSALRGELRALTPHLETVKRQGAELLHAQSIQGERLAQVQEKLDAALALSSPLSSEGLTGAEASVFLSAQGRFQSALLSRDPMRAQDALSVMRALSPHGNTYRVSEIAFSATFQSVSDAESSRSKSGRRAAPDYTLGQTSFDVRVSQLGARIADLIQVVPAHACTVGARVLHDSLADMIIHASRGSKQDQLRFRLLLRRAFTFKFKWDSGDGLPTKRLRFKPSPVLSQWLNGELNDESNDERRVSWPHALSSQEPDRLHFWAPYAQYHLGREPNPQVAVKGLSTRRRLAWAVHVGSGMPLTWAVLIVRGWELALIEQLDQEKSFTAYGLGTFEFRQSSRVITDPDAKRRWWQLPPTKTVKGKKRVGFRSHSRLRRDIKY